MGVPLWLLGGLKPVWWLRDATLGCVCVLGAPLWLLGRVKPVWLWQEASLRGGR